MICKATEVFIGFLAVRAAQAMTKSKRKTIKDVDLIATVHSLDKLQFLRIDFPRTSTTKPVSNDGKSSATSANASSNAASMVNDGGGKVAVATGAGSIKSFFSTTAAASTTAASAPSEPTDNTTKTDVEEDGPDEEADGAEE